jgi:SSS family transporter
MSVVDWIVLFAFLAFVVTYGVWRGRGTRNLQGYLLADRVMPWYVVWLTVMATQASAITFLSTPGQGYADGMRFVQFYFGLPLAMIVLCVTAIPIYHRLGVYTAYEYLERRFDTKTRTLAALLFLTQRGLAAGLTIYAPSLIFSVLLGIPVQVICLFLGAIVVIYTASGGAKAVSHTQFLQFLVIMGTMTLALVLILLSLPRGVSLLDAAHVAGTMGRLNAIDPSFDLHNRYNLWSGLIGGLFLQLSYFGTDQSQVGRYLTGRSVSQSRLGLVMNGLVKVPMQFVILFLGALLFVFYQFVAPPVFFNPVEVAKVRHSAHAERFAAIEQRHRDAFEQRRQRVQALIAARETGDRIRLGVATDSLAASERRFTAVRGQAVELIRARDPRANPSDTNYIFLSFVLRHLPIGVVGLVLAAIFAASMNSISAELNALTSTSIVDVFKRLLGGGGSARAEVIASRIATVAWGAFAVAFAEYASRLGSLVEAVNILGSLFYGTILGIFLTAFYLPRVGGTAVFVAALAAEAAVIACFRLTAISFLWYNVIGCLLVMGFALAFAPVLRQRPPVESRARQPA